MGWKKAASLFALALLLYVLFVPQSGRQDLSLPAPPLTFPNLKGKPVSLSDFKGQVVLLDFWATWCGPCLEELPELKKLQEKYGPQGFTLLGVSVDENEKVVAPFVQENSVPYQILLAGNEPIDGYSLVGIPTAFLVSRQGIIVHKYLGPKSYEQVARDIEKFIAH